MKAVIHAQYGTGGDDAPRPPFDIPRPSLSARARIRPAALRLRYSEGGCRLRVVKSRSRNKKADIAAAVVRQANKLSCPPQLAEQPRVVPRAAHGAVRIEQRRRGAI